MKNSFCYPAVAFSIALLSSTPLWSQTAPSKQTPARQIDVKKVFPYYDIYLRLPPADRDGFRMVYRLGSRTPGPNPVLIYVLGNSRTPVQIGANGQILTMPDANMLANGKIEKAAGQPSGSITMDLEPVLPLSRSISIAAATNPLNDYAAAIRRAGPLALMAPRLSSVRFVGVTGGEALFGGGRTVPLPVLPDGGVLFTPSSPMMRGAAGLSFSSAPTRAEFSR